MSLQSNVAVLLLGAPNPKGLAVSQDLKDQRIDLLRRIPSEANIVAIPDKIQPKYPLYRGLLPHFLLSFVKKVRVSLGSQGCASAYVGPTLPLPLPDLVISWTVAVADEVVDEIRAKYQTVTATAKGRATLLVKVNKMSDLVELSKYKPNPVAPTVENGINLFAYRHLNVILRIFSSFLKMHSYPAWSDLEHYGEFSKHYDDQDEVTDIHPVTGTTIFGARSVASTTDYGNPTVIYKGPPAIEDAVGWISNPDHVPNADGLYIPFIRPLFHFDSKTVPEVIEMFFMKCLGDTTEDIIMTYRDIVSAWGNIWKSEIGIMLSVIALAIKVGLTAQARILPLFGGDRFLGVILSGSGFTIELEQVAYRPVPFASLVSVIKSSDPHVDALNQIAQLLGTDPAKVAVRKAKTMAELRAILRGTWTIENNTELLMKQAARLNFQEPSWNINSTTLDRALTLISHGNLPLTGIPIHYTMLLEEKRSHVVWSCFGGMAPSFRIPNSRPLSLEGAMEVAFRGKDGSKQKPVPVTKVACRSAVLEIALRDLDEMIRKKEILNPFGSPNQRASQMNLDRFFSGDEAKKIVAGLRGICGVTGADLAMVKRKAREDTGEEPTRKRPAGFDDF